MANFSTTEFIQRQFRWHSSCCAEIFRSVRMRTSKLLLATRYSPFAIRCLPDMPICRPHDLPISSGGRTLKSVRSAEVENLAEKGTHDRVRNGVPQKQHPVALYLLLYGGDGCIGFPTPGIPGGGAVLVMGSPPTPGWGLGMNIQ